VQLVPLRLLQAPNWLPPLVRQTLHLCLSHCLAWMVHWRWLKPLFQWGSTCLRCCCTGALVRAHVLLSFPSAPSHSSADLQPTQPNPTHSQRHPSNSPFDRRTCSSSSRGWWCLSLVLRAVISTFLRHSQPPNPFGARTLHPLGSAAPLRRSQPGHDAWCRGPVCCCSWCIRGGWSGHRGAVMAGLSGVQGG